MTMLNLSKNPLEVIPDCTGEVEFNLPNPLLFTHHDTFSATGIGENYANYWSGVLYWANALREGETSAFSYLEPVPMAYSEYIQKLHPECPITARNIYTVAAINALSSEAAHFFASERAQDPTAVEYLDNLYAKAIFLILGKDPGV